MDNKEISFRHGKGVLRQTNDGLSLGKRTMVLRQTSDNGPQGKRQSKIHIYAMHNRKLFYKSLVAGAFEPPVNGGVSPILHELGENFRLDALKPPSKNVTLHL